MLIRDATTADWPLIWPFLRQIVAAGETFTYDPELGHAEAEVMWMVNASGRVVVAAADDGDVAGTANMYANRAGPGAHIASASYMVDPARQGRGVGRPSSRTHCAGRELMASGACSLMPSPRPIPTQ